MKLVYNILQILVAPLLLAALPLVLIRRPEKCFSLPSRFGIGLDRQTRRGKVIWIHALSVGEITSALPLVQALRNTFPEHTLLCSATTTSGRACAQELLRPFVDGIVAFPVDILPVVKHFIKKIAPDLFILVETDFWPNLLFELSSQNIPAVLVNGRISARSMLTYRRFALLFRPLFSQFRFLCMQTAADTDAMRQLGVPSSLLCTLGNLKYAPPPEYNSAEHKTPAALTGSLTDSLLLLCGSTHPGEEQIILSSFVRLKARHAHLRLVFAPRQINRSSALLELAKQFGVTATLFSTPTDKAATVIIVDTLGDLAALYRFADIAFIGGSLVAEGGHNPLEAARHGCPIVFGRSMEDFSEISSELLSCQAAISVTDQADFEETVDSLICSPQLRRTMGQNSAACIQKHLDVIDTHIRVIETLL